MILELNHKQAEENLITSNVNLVIKDTLEQAQALEEIVESAPNILKGYSVFRDILRSVKRGQSFEEAINFNSGKSCPPDEIETINNACGHITCDECWRLFIENYADAVVNGDAALEE